MRLSDLRYGSGKLEYPSRHTRLPESTLGDQLERAVHILEKAQERAATAVLGPMASREGEYERLRWFAMPEEVAHDLRVAAS